MFQVEICWVDWLFKDKLRVLWAAVLALWPEANAVRFNRCCLPHHFIETKFKRVTRNFRIAACYDQFIHIPSAQTSVFQQQSSCNLAKITIYVWGMPWSTFILHVECYFTWIPRILSIVNANHNTNSRHFQIKLDCLYPLAHNFAQNDKTVIDTLYRRH